MTHSLLAVHGPTDLNELYGYGSEAEMQEAFAATGALTE